jgi:hypothetical protein
MRARRSAAAAAVAVVALVLPTACSSSAPRTSEAPSPSPVAPDSSGTSSAPAADVDHTVPAPGPRQPGVLAPADLMVVSGSSLTPEQVSAVSDTKGVTSVEVISLSESVVENQSLRVAAVDPATYRTFTRQETADFQEAWDRLAGGELALKKRLQTRAPLSETGYLKLGAAADAPSVHVGAYIDQQPLIDAVVNETWIDTLGMTPDNAMLVRTGDTAPAGVRDAVEKVLGKGASVQLADLATRRGLDPSAIQVAVVTGSVADAVGVYKYSLLGGGRIAPEQSWVSEHIATETVPILGSVTCNKVIFPQLKAALQEVVDRGLESAIHPEQYAGCYYPRFIAGSSTLSNHAFGLALDLNAVENGRGTAGRLPRGVIEAFQRWGFTWGGDWKYTDPMHFEMNSIVSPQVAARSAAP